MVLLKIVVFSFLAFTLTPGPSAPITGCGDITATAKVSEESGRSRVTLTVKGGQSPYKYVFSKQSGELISEHFDSNTVDGLEKGKYFCTVVDKKYCKMTIEIEIK